MCRITVILTKLNTFWHTFWTKIINILLFKLYRLYLKWIIWITNPKGIKS